MVRLPIIAISCVFQTNILKYFLLKSTVYFCFFILKADDEAQYNQQSAVRQPNKSPSRWVFQLCIICIFQGNLHTVWYHIEEYEDS
jgi:hypothetical protein